MNHENFLTEYCKNVDQFHGRRADRLWFSTWVASKSPYFTYAEKFVEHWSGNSKIEGSKFPQTPCRVRLIFRLFLTLLSVSAKATFLKFAYRKELRELKALSEINLVRTFRFSKSPFEADPFWGPLLPALAQQPIPLVTIFEPSFSVFDCHSTFQSEQQNFPYFVFLKPTKLLKNFFELVKESYASPPNGASELVVQSYRTELLTPIALTSLCFYDCFFEFFENFKVHKLYLPFENNPWEKMAYIARSNTDSRVKIIGFQHATIQQDAANYFLSKYESEHKLHPDVIFCVGEVTCAQLKSYRHYENIDVRVGCALRMSQLSTGPHRLEINSFQRLLVALDGTSDSLQLANFAAELTLTSGLDVRVKEHPNFPIAQEIKNRLSVTTESLSSALTWCDAILYSGTTVSLEGLALGKPALHYKLANSHFNFDPIYRCPEYRFEVDTPASVEAVLERLRSSSGVELKRQVEAAQSFAKSYLSPCTRDSIERFLSA